MTLDRAYAHCRAIAKQEAKNFYYAFVALPSTRRNAICAVYAFMRKADDLADDESISRGNVNATSMAGSLRGTRLCKGGSTGDPVFLAVRDAVARFKIPLSLLDELVAGVTMDLVHDTASAPDTYATFAHLYRYCYLVASVVGLVCIRIFGYTDPRAEKFAEETGIAFQLTNILRDVVEDASRNRVYLPLDELAEHGVSLDSLLHRAPCSPPTANELALLKFIADRAGEYYKSAEKLLPLIAPESRPALRVLVSIYHALLKRIVAADYDVFTRRASVPTAQKLAIMLGGLGRMAWARLNG